MTVHWSDGTSQDSAATSIDTQRGARAWVSMQGTGTVGIHEDYNVSSITDNASGNYTVNIDSDLTDGDWAGFCSLATSYDSENQTSEHVEFFPRSTAAAGSGKVRTGQTEGNDAEDHETVYVGFFR